MVDKLLHGYAYDAAGRLVKEGAKAYRYGYLDKVLAVTEGNVRYTYGYHVDGQLATATKCSAVKPKKGEKPPAPETEEFFWDGLALVKRGGTSYVNEPHPGNAPQKLCFGGKPRAQRSARRVRKQPRGAAVLSSKDGVMFNDILGTTLGSDGENGYTATPMTAFGDAAGGAKSSGADALFTGKPHVDGLGHAFLFRNYRAGLGKWLTADPLGYPDGWNQLAYCANGVMAQIDFMGAKVESGTATWDWRYQNKFRDIWTGFTMVLNCNIFTVEIYYHIVSASNIPVIVVDSIQQNFECNTSDSWTLSVGIPVTVKGMTVSAPTSVGYNYRVEQTIHDPIYWSDDKYNYVSQMYKFDIYSYDWVSVFGFESQFFNTLEAWTDVTLFGKCRKE